MKSYMPKYRGATLRMTLAAKWVLLLALVQIAAYSAAQGLSAERTQSISQYNSRYIQLPDSHTTEQYDGRDRRGLLRMIDADSLMPARTEAMSIANGIVDADSNNLVAEDRAFAVDTIPAPLVEDVAIVECTPADTAPEPGRKPFYMALKTNLIHDALALPEIGAEFYVGRNWSVVGNWTYGWWDCNRRHRYWRAYGGDVAVRRWFGRQAEKKPLTGHHIGVYAGAVTYDFEFGGTGVMGGRPHHTIFDRCNFYCGVEYGFSLPVHRRLNIDFTLGIGYLGGNYIKYSPADSGYGYIWQSTRHINWFGPTKAEISLVWLIGRDNINKL